MNAAEFIAKWRKVELKERSAAQEHFLDLCRMLGHPTPAEADPTGETFCFEKGAEKHGGGDGFADVWKKDFFGLEYKGKHKDLDNAYNQLLLYRDALASPPLLVVCDLDRIVIHTNFTKTVSVAHEIPLERLGEPRSLEILRAVFFDPEKLRPGKTSVAITQEAAQHFADMAESMRKRGLDSAEVAHFLDRVVFCLFAEDIGLLPNQIFTRITEKSGGDPAKFARFIAQLFEAMATGGEFGLETIRHFNGNLFDGATVPDLTADEVTRITASARLDWSAVEPSIFGTLFERGLDPAKRSQLGAHFTGKEDIDVLVDAVVMQPLRREWEEVKRVVHNLLATGKKTGSVSGRASGSAGILPASSQAGGTPALQRSHKEWHSRGYLPHFDHPGLVQSVTFRLADSLPAEKLAQWQAELEIPAGARAFGPQVIEYHRRIEEWLDRGHGSCALRDSRVASMVAGALLHFDGERYRLLAWVVMPNHVHVLIETLPGFPLGDVVHSWKSYSAKQANQILAQTGRFWQEEYFDRYIRDADHLREARRYIEQNPVEAGLAKTAEAWPFGSSSGRFSGSAGILPASSDAGGTPALRQDKPLVGPAKKKAMGEAEAIIQRFLTRLQSVKVLDPACGSGNFLYVTLQKLKDLEKSVILHSMDSGLASFFPMIGPWQLYGIELNPYAHDLAQMTVWIGWLQWLKFNGFGSPEEPILRAMSSNFQCKDSILDLSDSANPKEPDWPKVDFIVGNPPFLGGKMLRRELGDTYIDQLFAVWKDRVPREADLCCYWFEKARAQIETGRCKRAGLLATQGIRGGANREILKRINKSGDIFWAVSDQNWILDGANVHVSIVGFDNGTEETRTLNGKAVDMINPNLSTAADITLAQVLVENMGIAYMGDTKVGPFDIPESLAHEWLALQNPNGKSNAEVVRPWANGVEITRIPQKLWIVDFPPGMTEAEASQYEAPFEYIREKVKPTRIGNKRKVYAERWWIHGEARPEVRASCLTLPRYLATPCVSKHRIFIWMKPIVLPDHALFVFARSDDVFFGVLHSRLHEVWALALGTQLREKESGFRYTATTCFETFPMPHPTPAQAAVIADAAKKLDDARNNWLGDRSDKTRTLTALYNKKPTWLVDAHRALDAAVFAAYGWKPDLTDDDLLAALLALNQERAAPAAASKTIS